MYLAARRQKRQNYVLGEATQSAVLVHGTIRPCKAGRAVLHHARPYGRLSVLAQARLVQLAIEAFTACGCPIEHHPVAWLQRANAGTGLDYGARAFMSQPNRQCMRRRPSSQLPVALADAGCLYLDEHFADWGRLQRKTLNRNEALYRT